jgi:peptidoglycan/LPS O-acetylase OafA/YrhL
MISGYVIFWTISRRSHPLDFVFSRFSRLYPAYWVAVLFTFTWVALVGPEDRAVDVFTLLANITMLHEYLGFRHVDGVYWTLSVELHFYLLAMIALILRLVRYSDWICFAWLLGSAITVVANFWLWGLRPFLMVEWSYLFGAGIAFYLLSQGNSRLIPLVSLLLSYTLNWLINPVSEALIITCYYGLMAGAVYKKLPWLTSPTLLWVGGISYALYLLHQNFGYGLISWGYQQSISPVVTIIASVLLSFLLAVALTRFETVALRHLRKWYKTRQKQAVNA